MSDPPPRPRTATGLNWPGRGEGLTDRDSEILALITQGKSNTEVAALTFLSPNTVKSYVRTITARSMSAAAPKRCCGVSRTASPPTTTASTTGVAAPDHDCCTQPMPTNFTGGTMGERGHNESRTPWPG